ncbi:MAG: MAPEG family protein [Proteobacteria bacterium]|nr:MAPEG family protein [Pseudomonadota bacterium]
MSPDLKYLLFSTILTFVQVLVAAIGANQAVGLNTLAGNREGLGEIPGWAGRAKRAHLNMIENMVLFAALVLIATAAGKANAMTAMGAMIFFWARVAYAVIYLAGIAWLRTLVWFVSVIGMAMIAWELLKAM